MVCNLFKVKKKRHQNDLTDLKTLRITDVALVSLLLPAEFTSSDQSTDK